MAENIIMKVTEYDNEDIYPGENISFNVTKEDGTVFPDTGSLDIEIYDHSETKIKTQAVSLEIDKLSFKVKYLDTADWVRGNDYSVWGRYKDSATDYNNVVVDISLKVK